MAFTTRNDGVIVKLPLSKYRELKEDNQLLDNEAYVISDIDDYLSDTASVQYWQVRVNRVIPINNYLFFNQSGVNLSGLPLNTALLTLTGQNGTISHLKIEFSNNQYELVARVEQNSAYREVLATGSTQSNMTFCIQYMEFTYVGYGNFFKVTYMHPDLLGMADNVVKLNSIDF